MDENNEQIDEQIEDDAPAHTFRGWWAVAAIIVVVIGFLGWSELRLRSVHLELETLSSQMSELDNQNQSLQHQYDSARLRLETIRAASHVFQLVSSDETVSGSATVYLDQESRRAVIVFEDLPPNDRTVENYHLWLSGGEGAEPSLASVFDIGESGQAELMMQHLAADSAASGMSVTLEPVGEVKTPSEPVILSGSP